MFTDILEMGFFLNFGWKMINIGNECDEPDISNWKWEMTN